jgi:hypothetical protein
MIRIKTMVEGKSVRTLFNFYSNNWITIWESQSLDSNSLAQAAKTHLQTCISLQTKKAKDNDQQRTPQANHNEPSNGETPQEAEAVVEIGGNEVEAENQAAEAPSSL